MNKSITHWGTNWRMRAFPVLALCVATATALRAQTFTTVFSFDGADGSGSHGALVQATNGYLYGTTTSGGVDEFGTVFGITTSGNLMSLYGFVGVPAGGPAAGLVQATNGFLYGTTVYDEPSGTAGSVFVIVAGAALTTIHSFCTQTSGCSDGGAGEIPAAGLVQAADGDLYGTTSGGGASTTACASGCGTVFKMTTDGAITTLYSFCSQAACPNGDGQIPVAGLVQAANGDLWGTTLGGGAYGDCCYGGTVFKITPTGTLTTLHSFGSGSDGEAPVAGLVQATNGDFFGTTLYGGAHAGPNQSTAGTVFKITPSGTLTTLHSFCSQSGCEDGCYPRAGLIQATDGNLYGTTSSCGTGGAGTVFKITPGGTLTTLYAFCSQSGCTDGKNPATSLVQYTDGNLYGTTLGGASGYGTVFRLSVGLSPFAKTQSPSGAVGAVVWILGDDLSGATSVTFNGTAAKFTVAPFGTFLGTHVPTGATSGTVEVVTPTGTLSSYPPFQVLP
jgi:uncharacterized repeat protein (TIGR03803 family)